eukprot:554114-Pyramimonas_sp.AAC.1
MCSWERKATGLHNLKEISLGLASQCRPCLRPRRSVLRALQSLSPCCEGGSDTSSPWGKILPLQAVQYVVHPRELLGMVHDGGA